MTNAENMCADRGAKPVESRDLRRRFCSGEFVARLFPAAVFAAILLLLAVIMAGCAPSDRSEQSRSITVAGSTSVQPFAEMLAEEYARLFPQEPAVNVQGGGSSAGARAALSGAAQIGMLSRELAPAESQLTPIVIARDAIAVIVHPGNPVSNLSKSQVQAIFSGDITDWSQVGGPPGKIHLISREEGSGTRGAFDELVMHGRDVSPRAIVQDSNGAVRETVASDRYAIGYISLGLVDARVKALRIDGVEPTVDNCREGRYILVRPFLFAVKGEPSPETRRFIDFVLGPRGQGILAEEGLIPVGPSGH